MNFCPRCGAQIVRNDAEFCSKCGVALAGSPVSAAPSAGRSAPVPVPEREYRYSELSLAVALLVVLTIVGVGWAVTGGRQTTKSAPVVSGSMARVICRDYVTQRLKAPSTAEFGGAMETQDVNLGGGKYRVTSYVDAQNGFGAQIRMQWACTVQYTGNDRWQLVDLVTDP